MDRLKKGAFDGHGSLNAGQRLLGEKTLEDLLNETRDAANIFKYESAAGAGGAATEAMVLTGLLADDEILAVSQKTPGANSLPLLGWTTQAADALTCTWSADPGAGAVVVVEVRRATS